MSRTKIGIGNVVVGDGRLALIAGPCAVESEEVVFKTAETIAGVRDKYKIPVIFNLPIKKPIVYQADHSRQLVSVKRYQFCRM